VFEVLAEAADMASELWLLVRLRHDRRLEDGEPKLLAHVHALPVAGVMQVAVPRGEKRKARTAELRVRFGEVLLPPPVKRVAAERERGPVKTYVVEVDEKAKRGVADPICWRLLTTRPINNLKDAKRAVEHYACRWVIEQFFRTLKTDCDYESRQFRSVDRLEKALVLDAIVAWRLMYLTTAARSRPDLPCDEVFPRHEWQTLWILADEEPPDKTPTLGDAAQLIAELGGYRPRDDCPPGVTVLRRGLHQLATALEFRARLDARK
jgi:hypothetical protein